MKTLVIGDLHGHMEAVDRAVDTGHNVVFVGDYLDSFGRSVLQQIEVLQRVLRLCEEQPERFQGLLGNHEWSYLREDMRCSGYNPATHAHVAHLQSRMRRILKPFTWVERVLITHAGLSGRLLKQREEMVETYLEKEDFFQIGRSRGGWDKTGGIFWCDWHAEFVPVPGLHQIFGHSNRRFPKEDYGVRVLRENGGSGWNVDCLGRRMEAAQIENGRIETVSIA